MRRYLAYRLHRGCGAVGYNRVLVARSTACQIPYSSQGCSVLFKNDAISGLKSHEIAKRGIDSDETVVMSFSQAS